MQINRALIATLGLVLMGLSPCVHADKSVGQSAAQKAIEKQYEKIAQGLKTKNIKPLQEVTTPDYTLTVPGGKVIKRQQMEAQFTTQLSFLQTVTGATEKLTKLTVKGEEATADVQETLSGVISDPQTQGKVHKVDTSSHYHDIWIKSKGNWLRKHTDLVKVDLSMDGKPLNLNGLINEGPHSSATGVAPSKK